MYICTCSYRPFENENKQNETRPSPTSKIKETKKYQEEMRERKSFVETHSRISEDSSSSSIRKL